jgi:hypothetical protein
VFPGAIDTDMLRHRRARAPKASARSVADGALDGLSAGDEDIFSDPVARFLGEIRSGDPKRYERLLGGSDELVALLAQARATGELETV